MADDVDFATELQEAAVQSSRSAVRRALEGAGADKCDDCEVSIDPRRRAAAPFAQRCLPCQMIFERESV